MENAKKMILVEPETLEKLKNNDSVNNNLSRLDEEMHNVLKTKTNDREKWSLYLQTLQRYLYFISQGRKPLEIPIISLDATENDKSENTEDPNLDTKQSAPKVDEASGSVSDSYTKSQLIQLLPKTYKIKGELLLDILLKNKDKIYWNQGGTVFINKKEIYRSNIVDLLNDIIRPLKNSSPDGWPEFAAILKQLRVPLSYIGNPRRATYINVLDKTPEFNKNIEKSVEKESDYSTPQSSILYKDKGKKKIDWERWTPY